MRQPKFRGFCLETKSWNYGHGWFESDYTDEYLNGKGIKQQAILYTDGYPVECELASMGEYTGLKDKNGKEIYEGDVVEFNDFDSLRTGGHTDDNIIQGKVSFSFGAWMVESEKGHYDLYTAIINDEELEVIGNIYENPELVGDNK